MITLNAQKTISMMQLRSKPGTLLDNVFYRNESFVIEKAGEPRAAIVSLYDYEQLQQVRQQARQRYMQRVRESQKVFGDLTEEEKQQLADEASTQARTTPSA